MGLSATQMRFLMVTARKSNVEFQGQQVNQARTDLANQSSALYTELLQLKAPTAPSKYTYIISPTTMPNIDWSDNMAYPLRGDELKNFLVHYAANQPSFQDFNIPEYVEQFDDAGNSIGWRKYLGKDENNKDTYEDRLVTDLSGESGVFCTRETGYYSTKSETSYYALHINDPNVDYDIERCMFTLKQNTDANGNELKLEPWFEAYNLAMSQYMAYTKPAKTAIYATTAGLTDLGDNVNSNNPNPTAYKLSYSTKENAESNSYNEAQYAAALEQYQQDLAEYEKAYAEINKKTEEIHEADKKLELQLKQLDTEQEAIQTEYDALKKVLDKNIENTFKTFG